ncbi:MAG: hypothetical protein EPN74_10330 [Rhodanobacter sp.]|nr:MAG: hypothetical protein EPN74_10330 [Rhodanobacter sp.]
MKRGKNHSWGQAHKVDWNDPELESLLQKSKNESWQLDNRENHSPQEVTIHLADGSGEIKDATLVWQRDEVMVIQAASLLQTGQRVQVERRFGDGLQIFNGVVVESRLGRRDDDEANGVHVHWLQAVE